MNGFDRQIEHIKAALAARKANKVSLVCADGSQLSLGLLDAVDAIAKREDIVDVLADDDTTVSLLRAMLGPCDFSDLEELADQ